MEPENVFHLCTECHQRLDPNGGGEVVMLYDHEDALDAILTHVPLIDEPVTFHVAAERDLENDDYPVFMRTLDTHCGQIAAFQSLEGAKGWIALIELKRRSP